MALVGDHIGAVDSRVGFLAGEFQQRLVAGEMAALREVEAAIGRLFADLADGRGGLPRAGGEVFQPHMGQLGIAARG